MYLSRFAKQISVSVQSFVTDLHKDGKFGKNDVENYDARAFIHARTHARTGNVWSKN